MLTVQEYENILNDHYYGMLLGKRYLKQMSVIASEELGERVIIEQAKIDASDTRLEVYRA